MSLSFKFYDFDVDIVKNSYSLAEGKNVLYVLPTASNKKALIKSHQFSKSAGYIDFLTWHEFKDFMILPNKPIVSDFQRAWLMYKSCENEVLDYFKISSFLDFIPFSETINDFIIELSEENILVNDLSFDDTGDVKSFLQVDWQISSVKNIQKLLQSYITTLNEVNYSDSFQVNYEIFKGEFKLNKLFLQKYDEIIIVNQFQYSKLDKLIVDFANSEVEKVKVVLQMPAEWYDKENMIMVDKPDLSLVSNFKTEEIHFNICSNQIEMWNSGVSKIDKFESAFVIDNSFRNSDMFGLLNQHIVRVKNSFTVVESAFYEVLHKFKDLINSITKIEQSPYFNLNQILSALKNKYFCSLYFAEVPQEMIDRLIIMQYHDQYIYLDLNTNNFESPDWIPLKNILNDVKRINYMSFVDFIEFIQDIADNDRLDLRIEERNFIKTEILTFKNNCDLLPEYLDSENASGVKLLSLFLLTIAKKEIHFERENIDSSVMITHLDDVRNRSFDEPIFIMNANEGILPSAPKSMFLLNEIQREQIGLTTFDDKRKREWYYFFRLIFNSKSVNLYALEDIEKNTFVGSFFEETMLWAKHSGLKHDFTNVEDNFDNRYDIWWKNISKEENKFEIYNKKELVIPFKEPENRKIPMTFYSIKQILKDSAAYYLQYECKLKSQPDEVDETLNVRKLGIILHEVLNFCWKKINKVRNGSLKGLLDSNVIEQWINEAIESNLSSNYYLNLIIPHDYSKIYFQKILLPFMTAGIKSFFTQLADSFLFDDLSNYVIIPESDFMSKKEREGFRVDIDSLESDVWIRGKADLILKNNDSYYIVDYKISNSDKFKDKTMKWQLVIYEQLYKEKSFEADSSFYFMMDRVFKSDKSLTIDNLREQLVDVWDDVKLKGFRAPEKNSQKNPFWKVLY
jgi:hypothetical protein